MRIFRIIFLFLCLLGSKYNSFAQTEAMVNARADVGRISVGDQARVFIEAQHNAATGNLQWAVIPDTFNTLEVVERGKIDTLKKGDVAIYKQRLLVTGFDSGMYMVPSFQFTIIPKQGSPYIVNSDSIPLLVQTVAVDTTKGFRDIKGIMQVETSWLDYIWYIIGGALFMALIIFVIWYFRKNKKTVGPAVFNKVQETLQEKALRYLDELERDQLWQQGKVKEYYTRLTDILRQYIEERFRTPAMELTTDELLHTGRMHKGIQPHVDTLAQILYTADMAKFARAQPTVQEHTTAMHNARKFVKDTPDQTDITPVQS